MCIPRRDRATDGTPARQVHERRTKREFTQFCQELAAQYPDAAKIRLVLDNLNTHNASSFYEHLSAEQAFALSERFEFIYTPKGASWLNMIECEFSVISRQCLDRRIATIERLRSEVLALLEERSAKAIKINWQFSIAAARSKFNSHYIRINPANQKYKETQFTEYSCCGANAAVPSFHRAQLLKVRGRIDSVTDASPKSSPTGHIQACSGDV